MSGAIINAPVIVFAGAGASAHLGYPTGAKFLERLNRKVNAMDDDFAQKLWQSIPAPPGPGNIKADFEDIHDWLEGLSASLRVLDVQGTELSKNLAQTRDCAVNLKKLIEEEIIEVYGTPVDTISEGMSECWGRFLDTIYPDWAHLVPIFTTNYDISFEYLRPELRDKYGIYVEDAFDRDVPGRHPWVRDQLSDWLPDDGKRYIWIFRLHGCVAWSGFLDVPPAYFYLDENGRPAPQRFSPREHALIWPSKHKRPFEQPYWTEYRYFLRCLDRAAVVIFLGYGFADDHIKAAVAEAKQYNRNLRIIVISGEGEQDEFMSRVSPIWPGHVRFIQEFFTPEGIEKLLARCNKVLHLRMI